MKIIRLIRTQKGFTLEEVAAQSGIHISSLIRIETGQGNPTVQTLEAIAQALHVQLAEFFPRQAPKRSGTSRRRGAAL